MPLNPFQPNQSSASQTTPYGGHVLQTGDSDKLQKWGGKVHTDIPAGDFVRELQTDLKAVGCYDLGIDGGFGDGTSKAVKRFQWCLLNGTHRSATRMCMLQSIQRSAAIIVTGMADRHTAQYLRAWAADGFEVTGTLRVVPISRYDRFRKGTLKRIEHPSVGDSEMVVHKDFVGSLAVINAAARKADILFRVNQIMRIAGQPVRGAVVRPASRSQHLIGNAIDFNLVHDGKTILSSAMNWPTLPQDVRDFINEVKAADIRWGGDWQQRDPIHFDSYVDPGGIDFEMLYFLNQRTIQHDQSILRVS